MLELAKEVPFTGDHWTSVSIYNYLGSTTYFTDKRTECEIAVIKFQSFRYAV